MNSPNETIISEGDVQQALEATRMERVRDPEFKPGRSFLQRRLRWGFHRASLVLPVLLKQLEQPTSAHTAGRLTVEPDHTEPKLHTLWADGVLVARTCFAPQSEANAARLASSWNEYDTLRDSVAKLRASLKPFAAFACDEPCDCHNCKARSVLAETEHLDK
jgi:hypothetical protein